MNGPRTPIRDTALNGPLSTGIAGLVLDFGFIEVDGGHAGAMQAHEECCPIHAGKPSGFARREPSLLKQFRGQAEPRVRILLAWCRG